MTSGPPPKREDERRRRNKDVIATEKINVAELAARDIEIPVADPDWHPIATMLWESLPRSGQAIFYEPADWAAAYFLCETIDRELKPKDIKVGQIGGGEGSTNVDYVFEAKIVPVPGGSLSSILKGFGALMMLEGDRRKLRLELERAKAKDAADANANVVPITQKRQSRFER